MATKVIPRKPQGHYVDRVSIVEIKERPLKMKTSNVGSESKTIIADWLQAYDIFITQNPPNGRYNLWFDKPKILEIVYAALCKNKVQTTWGYVQVSIQKASRKKGSEKGRVDEKLDLQIESRLDELIKEIKKISLKNEIRILDENDIYRFPESEWRKSAFMAQSTEKEYIIGSNDKDIIGLMMSILDNIDYEIMLICLEIQLSYSGDWGKEIKPILKKIMIDNEVSAIS